MFYNSSSSNDDDDDNGREPVYTEDGEYESVSSSEDEKGNIYGQ